MVSEMNFFIRFRELAKSAQRQAIAFCCLLGFRTLSFTDSDHCNRHGWLFISQRPGNGYVVLSSISSVTVAATYLAHWLVLNGKPFEKLLICVPVGSLSGPITIFTSST